MRLRSAYDREIFRLAVPALGALAAEPLYVLVDTAIVGHLGRSQLAALGAAATVVSVFAMFNFLQYATTAQVARATGAREDVVARRLGAQAFWLSVAIGLALGAALAALAGELVALVGVEGQSAAYAETYLRIIAIGVPSFFLAVSGQGFLRGRAELTAPLVVIVLGNVLNAVLEVLFVYGFGWGIEGSAWGTAIAQSCMGAGFVWLIVSRAGRENMAPVLTLARRLLSVGKFIFVRTAALISAFLLAGAVVARFGDAELGAYPVSFQLFLFLALVLDAIAIAGQIIVGRELGAGRPERAYDASLRMITLSVATGALFAVALLALADALPRLFSSDEAVLAECAALWPIFALLQPVSGAVFALDGILIGASDGPYIAGSMVVAFAACASCLALAAVRDWGVRGVWASLAALIVVRAATMGARFARRRWLVTGWA
jgi:putative MATE family efflux protein